MSAKEIGPFLFGLYGIEPTEDGIGLLQDSGAAGIVLRRRNIETPNQVVALVDNLEARLGRRLLVAVEHEGGGATPFLRGMTLFPGNAALGRNGSPALAYEVGRAMARELAAMKITMNLAPVMDLEGNTYHPEQVLRSFGKDPHLVGDLGAEVIRGLQEGGVSSVARHFPGRGGEVPVPRGEISPVPMSRERLLERDLVPFRKAVAVGVDAIMTSRAIYPALRANSSAVFASEVVTDLLRKEMQFPGVIVADDLTVPAILALGPIEEGVVQSMEAGHDLLIVANDPDLQRRAMQAYQAACDSGRLPADRREATQRRLRALIDRKKRKAPPEDAEPASALAELISGSAVHVERDPQGLIPTKRTDRTGILFPRMMDLADRVVVDDELRGASGLVQGWLQNNLSGADVLEIPIQPEGDMLDLSLDWAAALDVVAFFCFDAHRFPGQRRILVELQRRCRRTIVILMHNPWDREFVGEGASLVQLYGYRVGQINAAVDLLFHPA